MNKEEMIRNKILLVSKEMLEAHGQDKLTISNICKECSISRSTFYKHFPSKEKLMKNLNSPFKEPAQDIDNMRELILYTAKELVVQKGFDNVSMNDIAKKIGVNRTSLYSYFSSISEISKYLLEKELRNREIFEESIGAGGAAVLDKLKQYADYYFNLLDKHNLRLIIEMLEKYYVSQDIKEGLNSIEKFSTASILKLIEVGKKEGIFSSDTDAMTLAILMNILSYGIAVYSYLHPECNPAKELKEPVLDLLLGKR